ncbi:hypothetical protein EZV62_021313 [Acer yangbiense]|uniref:Cathepsin propeptide inhibitor domain-containing protein n=1 Tax=Acer yangbiense TaxID=1000413 RepID=A0A5C7H584_9ROSI|nr:hypothetical protein EZV62_021313 [Acer yangbiense]
MAYINAAPSSFFSFFVLLSLISTAFTSMHGLNHDPLIIQQVVSSNDHDDLLMMTAEHQFSAFKKEYGKIYPTQEEDDYRFGVFISNLRQARRNQIKDPTAIHGVTKFSDLTSSEFRNQYLLLDQNIQLPKNLKKAPILPTEDLPETYDWREYDAVTEVKDQGECECCWAFADIATLEMAHFMSKSNLVELIEQQLVDCSDDVKCWSIIEPDEDQIAANLVNYSTIALQINGAMMKTYKAGVVCPDECSNVLNHGVTLVGYGSDRHWII